MMTAGVGVPIEALATLRRRLAALPGGRPQMWYGSGRLRDLRAPANLRGARRDGRPCHQESIASGGVA